MSTSQQQIAQSSNTTSSDEGFARSTELLEQRGYEVHDEVQRAGSAHTGTPHTYDCHIKSYEVWFLNEEAMKWNSDPTYTRLPPFPVTVAKVVSFLEYEMNRLMKKHSRDEGSMEGTTVGRASIQAAISALEFIHGRDEHLYPNDPSTQKPLRRIAEFVFWDQHEKECPSLGEDVPGVESNWFFCSPVEHDSPQNKEWLGSSAVRPSNGWSELFHEELPNKEIRNDVTISGLFMLSYNLKHNQLGRLDEHGVIQHHCVELCPIGAIAMHFFALFHIQKISETNFEPDFSDNAKKAGHGLYGRCAWYDYKVFFASAIDKEMSYDKMYGASDILISKVTHAGRNYAAQKAHQNGVSVDDTKALGG
ncbi:hypothetical protein M422DRAFT_265998 [Sphaerobolus stellatus SS14]|uniref:Uncharacterized protein n=1 Tax=Sphaerobolus stellatus (strain SS14) TaxID=990650 RepID=A0A0C9USK1_SPHS4|nr:hypothetical protein M422DRAFT_265998 [Sphaerobolus stellatus SS14]